MDAVHLHLLLSHVPVLGSLFAVLLLGYALLRKNEETKYLSLIILIFSALVTIPVYLTGEPAEEVAEKLVGVSHAVIEEHESGAKISMILMMITGAVSLLGFLFMRRAMNVARWAVLLAFVLSVVTAGSMVRTGNLGGQIRHTEIGSGGANVPSAETPKRETEKDDDR